MEKLLVFLGIGHDITNKKEQDDIILQQAKMASMGEMNWKYSPSVETAFINSLNLCNGFNT